uniref:ADP-ribosylation factor like GTPase 5C n=1 Tax=Rattus norvegicus TaxID=10116 RepID=D3ZES1_RAT
MRRLLGTPKPVLIRVGSDLTVPLDASRAQSHHRGTGQCRKDHHSLPVRTHFLMWDLGGQEALRSTWETYYSNAEFVILVIDSTDRNRLSTSREELYKILAHEALQDASVLIFANKQDVKDSMTTAEISQFLTLSAIKDHPWHIQGCCALTGEGLLAGLQWMHSQATTN